MTEDTSKIKEMIERALEDGVLSRGESEAIKTAINADHKVTQEEVHLWSELQRRVSEGEIMIN